jgi:hypothetical protein
MPVRRWKERKFGIELNPSNIERQGVLRETERVV